jgi:hypothetical protein
LARNLYAILQRCALAALLAGPAFSSDLTMKVLDPDTGHPIPEAALTIKRLNPPAEWQLTTDSSGMATLPEASAGRYWIDAAKTGYLDPTDPASIGRGFDFTPPQPLPRLLVLRRVAAISGRVLREDGRSMSGLGVWALPMARAQESPAWPRSEPGAVTDDQGAYRLHGLLPGAHLIAVFLPEQASTEQASGIAYFPDSTGPFNARTVDLAPGADLASIDIRFPKWKAGTVSGTISGLPESWQGRRAVIGLLPQDGLRLPVATARSEPDGRFRLLGTPPGSYQLVAFGPDTGSGLESPPEGPEARFAGVAVKLREGEELVQDLAFTPGFRVEVAATGAAACPGASSLQPRPLINWPDWWRFPDRQADARIIWENLPPGPYRFDMPNLDNACTFAGFPNGQEGKLSASVYVRSNMTLMARISTSNGAVTGTVTRNHQPVAGALVALWFNGASPFARQAATDSQGAFRFDTLPSGDYWIVTIPPPSEGPPAARPQPLAFRQFGLSPGQAHSVELAVTEGN